MMTKTDYFEMLHKEFVANKETAKYWAELADKCYDEGDFVGADQAQANGFFHLDIMKKIFNQMEKIR